MRHNGYVALGDLDLPERVKLYSEMEKSQRQFLKKTRRLGWRTWHPWPPDPLHQWSRQWEYPFAFGGLSRLGSGSGILDAGSGLTFFPYYCESKGYRVTCLDSEPRYVEAYAETNWAIRSGITFAVGPLEEIPFPDSSFDAVVCISVLEHTVSWQVCLDELIRVLRPKGLLVLTIDVKWGGHDGLDPRAVSAIHESLSRTFTDVLPLRLTPPPALLHTEHFRRFDPGRLPWTNPKYSGSPGRRLVGALRGVVPPFEPLALAGFLSRKME